MPNKKLTDSEITIKALKELLEVMLSEGDLQRTSTISHTIDLITRLQAKIEKCEKVEHFADKTIATLQAENERLKTELYLAKYTDTAKRTIKAEAYKEFANELKCRTHEISYNTMQVVNKDDIDNLLKELVGEDR